MQRVAIEVPEKVLLAEKVDVQTCAREMRILAAVKMYELGPSTSGRAAELAGMSRVEFLLTLERYKMFPLPAELEELETAHAQSSEQHITPVVFISDRGNRNPGADLQGSSDYACSCCRGESRACEVKRNDCAKAGESLLLYGRRPGASNGSLLPDQRIAIC